VSEEKVIFEFREQAEPLATPWAYVLQCPLLDLVDLTLVFNEFHRGAEPCVTF
jgi:hypothetical protein